jgi:hypothetical protein
VSTQPSAIPSRACVASTDRRMLNAECFLILQAKENKGQTDAGYMCM